MINWDLVSSLATGAGTLVLAVATFASVRSANRAARVAEQSLQAGLRPLMVSSRSQDAAQKIFVGDDRYVVVPGSGGIAESGGDVIYLALSPRNAGSGIGVLRGWRLEPDPRSDRRPALEEFRLQQRDLYIAPGDLGFWQAAFRDPADSQYEEARSLVTNADALAIDVLYGDYEGGQRTVSRFVLRRSGTASPPEAEKPRRSPARR
ncbi:MAG: hypothetical protein ACLQI7_03150 [Streptosporangiaceae bacterium]